MRERVRVAIGSAGFQWAIVAIILINAIALGFETLPEVAAEYGALISAIDTITTTIFVVEIGLKLYGLGGGFFRDRWNLFDLAIVVLSLLPALTSFSVVRSLRILRALRLLSAMPSMRRIVGALLAALPGVVSIVGLLVLMLYVAGVMATNMFAAVSEDYFGSLGDSLLTLFQITTGDGWSDILREVMPAQPFAWIFFVGYILISTFTVLNLFIGVVVNAMESQIKDEQQDIPAPRSGPDAELLAEVRMLRQEVQALTARRGP